jgi:hypothetical protein
MVNPGLAEPRAIDVLYWLGSFPAVLAALYIGAWALKTLHVRPRPAWLMLGVTGLHLFALFGMRTAMLLYWDLVRMLGVDINNPIASLIGVSMPLALSVLMWVLALMAAFAAKGDASGRGPEEAPA